MDRKRLWQFGAVGLIFVVIGMVTLNQSNGDGRYKYQVPSEKRIWTFLPHNTYKWWEYKVKQFQMSPVTQNDIVIFGDAITEYNSDWRSMLGANNIVNRGISSDRMDGFRNRIEQVTEGQPKQIFLEMGLNDLADKKSPEWVVDRWKNVVKIIQTESPQTKIVMVSLTPVDNSYKNQTVNNDDVKIVNRSLKQFAEKKNLTYVDIYSILVTKNGQLNQKYARDSANPNRLGYEKIAALLKNYVTN